MAPTRPTATTRWQLLATAGARSRATLHHYVRFAPHPADPDVPTLRPQLPPPRHPVGLPGLGRRHRRILQGLRRLPELRQLLFQLADLLVPPLDRRLALGQRVLLATHQLQQLSPVSPSS